MWQSFNPSNVVNSNSTGELHISVQEQATAHFSQLLQQG
jgi:hypothetical protein